MGTFFTADTHFGHLGIIKRCYRPFDTVEDMDETMISRWNEVVEERDTVYHLGDFGWKKKHSELIVPKLNGRIILVRGTHDKNLPQYLFIENYLLRYIRMEGEKITLCHYPMRSWPHSHHGSWQLHGHSHGRCAPLEGRCQLEVGVDVHDFYPISFEQVREMMKGRFRE